MKLSECCGASISSEILDEGKDAVGMCSACKEWSGIWDDEEEEDGED